MAIMNDFLAQLADAEKKAEQLRTQFDETIGKQAQASFEQIKGILDTYMRFLTEAQRNTILSMLRMKRAVDEPKAASKSNAGKTFTVAPKFQIPSGETWAGRGQPHKAFSAWSKTPAGRAWHKANPDQRYPAYPYAASASSAQPKPAAKKAAKGAKKAAKAPAKKAPKKARKKP